MVTRVRGCLSLFLLVLTGPASATDQDAKQYPPLSLPAKPVQQQVPLLDDLMPKKVEDAIAAFDAYDRGDYATALRLLLPLANEGNAAAQLDLGIMYSDGLGVRQHRAEGVKWYRLAAGQGNVSAQVLLGIIYDYGKGVPQNYSEAAKWYRLAAGQGNVSAQIFLGKLYEEGHGGPKNYAEAAKWYRLAADKGNVDAQLRIGRMYDFGRGVPQNKADAVKWYRLAAGQGDALAQVFLGLMYSNGEGVPQDYVQAHMWFNLAAAAQTDPQISNEAIAGRDRLANQMTPAQIADAQELARKWKSAAQVQNAAISPSPREQNPPPAQTSSGSGLFVAENGEVVTNAHVVEGCKTAEVTFQDRTTTAPVIARDSKMDLAFLKVPQRSPSAARLRLTVRQGESVFAYGFPLAGLLSSGGNFTAGTVTALSGLHDDSRSLQMSAPVQPGSSGGPLLDEFGNVVGVVVAKLDALRVARSTDDIPQNVNFAIKATVAADFLSAQGVRYTEGRIGPSVPPSDIAERARTLTVHIECTPPAHDRVTPSQQ